MTTGTNRKPINHGLMDKFPESVGVAAPVARTTDMAPAW